MSFFKQTTLTLIAKGGILIVSFVLNVLMARKLGAEGIGVVGTLQAFLVIGAQLGFLGMDRGAVYFIGLDKSRASTIAGTLISCGIIVSVFLYVIFIIAALVFPQILGGIKFNLYAIILLSILPLMVSLYSQNLLLVHQKIIEYNIIELGVRFGSLVLLVILYILTDPPLWIAATIWMLVFASFAMGIINAGYAWKTKPFILKIDWNALKDLVRYSWKNYYAGLMGFMIIKTDLLFLNAYISTSEAGIYRQVVWISDILISLPLVFSMLLFPKLMQEGAPKDSSLDERGEFTMLLARLVGLIMRIFWVIFAIIGVWFLGIFGEEFIQGYGPLLIVLGGIVFFGIQTILKVELFRRGLPMFLVVYSTICMVCKIIMNVMLIPKYGMYGAAWGSFVAHFLFMAFPLWYCIKNYGFKFSDTLFVRDSDIRLVVEKVKTLFRKEDSG